MAESTTKDRAWYPGKLLKNAMGSARSASSSSTSLSPRVFSPRSSGAPSDSLPAPTVDVSGVYQVISERDTGAISVIYQNGCDLTFHNSRWGPSSAVLSGHILKAKVMMLEVQGTFKNDIISWSTGHVSKRTGPPPADPREATKEDTAWFPGKNIKEGIEHVIEVREEKKAAKLAGQYERPRLGKRMLAKHNALKGKRPLASRTDDFSVGSISVEVLRGKFPTSRPYFIIELDGNECRTASAQTASPCWGEGALPAAAYTFPVYDPSSDLRVFLCDDERLKNEHPIGRVIIPLRDLCTNSVLPRPKPAHEVTFQVMPSTRQNSSDLEARYVEAVPHVPGSGMARPRKDLGTVDLRLELHLSAPGCRLLGLLAAYAEVGPPDPVEQVIDCSTSSWPVTSDPPSASSSPGKISKLKKRFTVPFSPKIIRLNVNRLTRTVRMPLLLCSPHVFLLPFVLFVTCFYAEPYQLPWVAFALVALNGAIASRHLAELTDDMIFWEDLVGESDMPTGLAALKNVGPTLASVQEKLGDMASALERQRNLFNFVDPPVTFVALALLSVVAAVLSALLYFLSQRLIWFMLGMAFLLPFITKSLETQTDDMDDKDDLGKKDLEKEGNEELHGRSDEPFLERSRVKSLARGVKLLQNVLLRVPDGQDIAHQYFCAMQVKNDVHKTYN